MYGSFVAGLLKMIKPDRKGPGSKSKKKEFCEDWNLAGSYLIP